MRKLFGLCFLAFAVCVVHGDDKPNPKVAIDLKIMAEVKDHNQIMQNLEHLSDIIGCRLTGSPSLEKANHWAEEKMKECGLSNVHLEPYEIPIGWTRGTATLTLIEPVKRELIVASAGWTPGTNGPVTGPVVIFEARTKKDLEKYKGKLKDAVLLRNKPTLVGPVSEPGSSPGGGRRGGAVAPPAPAEPKAAEPKKDDPQPPAEPKKEEPKKDDQPMGRGGDFQQFQAELTEFFKSEGVACTLVDSGKPHGLLVTTGGFNDGDDRFKSKSKVPSLFIAHEHYALLYRLITEHKVEPKVTVNITNTFTDGPVTVYNTVGELPGTEKPEEIVLLGAHLDSWDLAAGTTDNGTGTSVILETARTLGKLAKEGLRPKRTLRFVLFTGEEQGLHGSKQYVKRHKDELDKHSAVLVHDTGTGKVLGLTLMGRKAIEPVLAPELETLKQIGFGGLEAGYMAGTDHLPFHGAGVPGFPCKQDPDEYRFTHHTQSDTFDKAKLVNLVQGAQVLAVAAYRIAELPEMLPREKVAPRGFRDREPAPMPKPDAKP